MKLTCSPLVGLFSDKNTRVVDRDIKSYLFMNNLIAVEIHLCPLIGQLPLSSKKKGGAT